MWARVAGEGFHIRAVLVVSVHEPHPRSKPVHPEAVKALLRAIERLEDET
jgi:hypothetical protein